MKIVVVGGGVIGFSCAIRLEEAGHDVEIWAAAFPPHTTSNIAAAIWYPYKAAPEEDVRRWGLATLAELTHLSTVAETGVRLARGVKYFHRPMGAPWWKDAAREFRFLEKSELPESVRCGYEFGVPVADMSHYLSRYLVGRFRGRKIQRKLSRIEEATDQADIVVNCTGLGARELMNDRQLYPIRGDILRVERLTQRDFILDTDNPAGAIYLIPREQDAVLGGTAIDYEESTTPDAETARRIRERCASLLAEAANAPLREYIVGLRPGRAAIRLERVNRVIHCYGHGGAGVTLSWGCADAVCQLVEDLCPAL